jgi:hypothetical protein
MAEPEAVFNRREGAGVARWSMKVRNRLGGNGWWGALPRSIEGVAAVRIQNVAGKKSGPQKLNHRKDKRFFEIKGESMYDSF